MFRLIRVSAAWLGCAIGALLYAAGAYANSQPLAFANGAPRLGAPTAPPLLRVLALSVTDGTPNAVGEQARRMLEDFARLVGRPLEWSATSEPADALRRLSTETFDIVIDPASALREEPPAAGLTATSPVATERYIVIGRTDNAARDPLALGHMSVAMSQGSPHWPYFERLQTVVPDLKLHALANELPLTAAVQLVADGMVDVAVVSVTGDPNFLADQPRVKRLFDLTAEHPVSWHVRSADPELVTTLNQFIDRYHTAYSEPSASVRDFAAIKRRGVLRVITRVEPGNYYIDHGKPSGFELELAANFAERHKLRLEVRVAHDADQMLDWLARGAGDLVTGRLAGSLTQGTPGFARSRSYGYEAFATVSRRELPLRSAADLEGLVFAAPEGSAAYRALASIRMRQPAMSVIAVSRAVSERLLLRRVAEGMVDATVVSGVDAARIRAQYPELVVGASIAHDYDYRWTMREGDETLLEAVDRFLADAQKTGLTSILAARYGTARGKTRTGLAAGGGRLSPYDPIVQRYAERYGFDWRLIAAQMYQESQFDPRAVSRSGARGLMQLMPRTALALGFPDLARPESAIHAGIKYLYKLRNEIDAGVPAGERTWFALAAYNLGPKRLEHARRYARQLGLNPNHWSGNVEAAVLRLAKPGGGANGRRYGQALIYVRSIQSLYGSYRSLQAATVLNAHSVPRA